MSLFTPMARAVLYGSSVLSLTGCLVSDPPDLEQSERVAPVLNLARANPAISQVQQLDADTERYPFNVTFRSEDGGDILLYCVYRNYSQPNPTLLELQPIDPSTYDVERTIAFELRTSSLTRGCNTVTLFVSAAENFVGCAPRNEAIARGEVAEATWWINFDEDPADPVPLGDCPSNIP